MRTELIINSAYILPAILELLDNPKSSSSLSIVREAGIGDQQVEDLREIKSLLQYHLKVVQSLDTPMLRVGLDYSSLREGLKEYFIKNLSGIYTNLGLMDLDVDFLDVGCGSGIYTKYFKLSNPKSRVTMIDKEEHYMNDETLTSEDWTFKLYNESFHMYDIETRLWHSYLKQFKGMFDIVLMSEILHCKTATQRDNILSRVDSLVKPGGMIIINENCDPFMQWRIQHIKGDNTIGMLNVGQCIKLMVEHGYRLTNINTYNYHNVQVYERI